MLVFDSKVRAARGQGANKCRHVDGDVARSRRNTDEAANNAGTKAENAELSVEKVFEKHPGDAAATCRQIGVYDNIDGAN